MQKSLFFFLYSLLILILLEDTHYDTYDLIVPHEVYHCLVNSLLYIKILLQKRIVQHHLTKTCSSSSLLNYRMVSATVIVTGSAIAVLAVSLIAYYTLSGKTVNGKVVSSLDMSGTGPRGETIYLNAANGEVNYDILTPSNGNGQQILTRYSSNSGSPFELHVAIDSTHFTNVSGWEVVNVDTTYSSPSMTSSGNKITLSVAGEADLVITLDAITNAPKKFGEYTVTSFNNGAYASRPTASLVTPASGVLGPAAQWHAASRRRNLVRRELNPEVNPNQAMKNCMNEIANIAYQTAGGSDWTIYVNACPPSAGQAPGRDGSNYGPRPASTQANPFPTSFGTLGPSNGGYCFRESQTQYCNGVLNGKTVVGFQGTHMPMTNGPTYFIMSLASCIAPSLVPGYSCTNTGILDVYYDLTFTLGLETPYSSSLGYTDGEGADGHGAQYDYCTGHSLGKFFLIFFCIFCIMCKFSN